VPDQLTEPNTLLVLLEEYVSATLDTICLCVAGEPETPAEVSGGLAWRAHLEYLKGLQREANAQLAALPVQVQ
jgi:hypothetical protein